MILSERLLKLRFLAMGLLFAVPGIAFSDPYSKVEVAAGGYALDATSRTGSGKITRFGSYRAGYRRSIIPDLEVMISYSLFTSELAGGDLGYGPEVGLLYYPFSMAQPISIDTANVHMFLSDVWHPFVGVGFHQRQFQSVASSYAGFSASAGAEFGLGKELGIKGEIRYMYLNGPSAATATMADALVGLVLYY